MIRHLLKLVWHRKRANALITIEIFASFLIVFVVATLGVSLWSRWNAPLGFDWHDVWVMSIESKIDRHVSGMHMTPGTTQASRISDTATMVDGVLKELKAFPQIETAAADSMGPYSHRVWTSILENQGRRVEVTADNASDDFARVMKIPLLRGRWFTDDDEVQNYQPIVIDKDAAAALFGNVDPIGKMIPAQQYNDNPALPKDFKVVGLIAPFRKEGEFTATATKMVFFRVSRRFPPDPQANQIVMRLRPGTPASFEAQLNDRLRPNAANLTIRVQHMDDMRRGSMRMALTPIAAGAVVALFLVSMVALGLTGVLWQTVTRRTREIGLRRAVGASRSGVRTQVLGEVAVLVTFAVIAGTIVVLQLPLLGLFRVATPSDFATGLVAALAAIYGITLLCGAYPSWLASTIQPAEALHYD